MAKGGDANTSYFHASVKGRCRKNSILALQVDDRWVESVSGGFDPGEVLTLTVSFTPTEIEEVMLSSDGDKSLGPDGFNFAFFKRFWGLLKDDMCGFCSTNFLSRLISREAFPLNEIIDLAKKSRKECLIFKVYFEGAYDSVNFYKSNIMGVNVSPEFLGVAEGFLHCRIGSIPFIYLGLPVGLNHRKEVTWQPLLDSLAKRLGVWRNKYVSLGGRVVLLNSVLNSIPIFYLSFMKMSVIVWKKIVQIQRNFLWGGPKSSRKIAWVSWGKVYMALYLHALKLEGVLGGLRRASCWWRNVSLLGDPEDAISDWFSEGVTKKVGNGHLTSFWFDPWLGESRLGLGFKGSFKFQTKVLVQWGRWVVGLKMILGFGSMTQLVNIQLNNSYSKVAFLDLKTLKLSSLNLDKIWNHKQHSMYNLSVLIVENCCELKYLFSSTMVESFVNLTRLEISKCNLMNEIIATESRNDGTISLNKVPFPKLETILLKDMENLKTVWHYQFDTVKTLQVQNCEKIVVVFPSSMQKTYHNLEMLVVKDCALVENIFELSSGDNSSIESATQLKVITFDGLPKLRTIWSRDPQGILSFHNLQNVDLNHCDSMEYLFPFSVATAIPHLEVLEIKLCRKMKEIVSEKTESTCPSLTFEFNQLNAIVLWCLVSLKGFYAGNHILTCPSLRKLDVFGCAKLNLYKNVAPSAFSLQRCQDENLSDLFQPLFIAEEVIPNLEWMRIDGWDAMIMQSENLDSLFNKLTYFGLFQNKNDEATFPSRFLQNARSLEALVVAGSSFKKIFEDERLLNLLDLPKLQHICEDGSQILEDCDSLQEIIMGKEDVDIAFVSLQRLVLKGLPSLNNFCSGKCCLKFPLLEHVAVSKCPRMEIFSEGNISTPSLRIVLIDEEWNWKGNLNDTIKKMFEDKGMGGVFSFAVDPLSPGVCFF
ncbi:hypothetical protein TSUD_176400 [Trifolium subterraneum]|uniref:Disease resistance protein At4g27190-like leucine-rich repeats domain-containing protein n=1 Tax=Trifolium subterraneum TaxID=3900 RepID=A0A2Z6MFR6_TRISU|nr:hypothetical protein TSUD_176400 [Trifolium subterraneum]